MFVVSIAARARGSVGSIASLARAREVRTGHTRRMHARPTVCHSKARGGPRVHRKPSDPIAPGHSFAAGRLVPWPGPPRVVSLETEKKARKVLIRKGEFYSGKQLPEERVYEIQEWCDGHGVALSQMLSLRSQLLTDKVRNGHQRLRSESQSIALRYERGESITAISRMYDLSPLACFREVMKLQHPEWRDTTATLRGRKEWKMLTKALRDPDQYLTDREANDLKECLELDLTNFLDTDMGAAAGRNFEDNVEEMLRRLGVEFLTEQEQKDAGRRVTPDFALPPKEPLIINGQPIYWIDAKAYYGAGSVCVMTRSLWKQTNRFRSCLGAGAVVFAQGFCSDLRVPDTVTLLDLDFPFNPQ